MGAPSYKTRVHLDDTLEWLFILGDYDVVYRYENGIGIPQNSTAVVAQVAIEPQGP